MGAIGAFMNAKCIEESEIWGENFAHSTGYHDPTKGIFSFFLKFLNRFFSETKREHKKSISTLELDLMDIPTQPFKSGIKNKLFFI